MGKADKMFLGIFFWVTTMLDWCTYILWMVLLEWYTQIWISKSLDCYGSLLNKEKQKTDAVLMVSICLRLL